MSSHCTSQSSLAVSEADDVDDDLKSIFKDFHIVTDLEVSESLEKCKLLIASESDETSTRRKFLVRKLVELRFRKAHINEDDKSIIVSGHSFKLLKQPSSKRIFCDFCSTYIWVSFQESFTCVNCCYAVHSKKCVNQVERLCSHIIACEKGVPEFRICPEIGLSFQKYRCAECSALFLNKQVYVEPRKCYYSGLYYCKSCHWNNSSIVVSNIIHNWDFEQRPVSRQALQEINIFYERPVIKLEELNPKLFVFNSKLGATKACRMQLMEMKRYLDVCRFAVSEKLINNVMGGRRYFIEGTEFYSIYDLVCVENCSLDDYLKGVIATFKNHVAKCAVSF